MTSYERIVEEEVMRETASWPEGREFETLPSTNRLTLNAILRAVFGDEGPALDELRRLLPATITVGSLLHLLPSIVGRDFGRWSPGGRLLRYRRRIDAVIDSLIAKARADPALEERSDVLAVLLQARYENGEPIPDRHIADELLTWSPPVTRQPPHNWPGQWSGCAGIHAGRGLSTKWTPADLNCDSVAADNPRWSNDLHEERKCIRMKLVAGSDSEAAV